MKKYEELKEEKPINDKNNNTTEFNEETPNYIRTSPDEKLYINNVRIINNINRKNPILLKMKKSN